MKKTYYLFRHGETFVTQSKGKKLWYGLHHFSAPTLPTGFQATKSIGAYLKNKPIDYYVSSQYLRCKETAAIVSKSTHKKISFDKRLNSFFIETPWHFRKRLQNFLADMESSDFQSIAICTHGLVLLVLVMLLTKKRFRFKEVFIHPLPGQLLIIKHGKLQIMNFN